jgi:hypothetical protein
LKIIDIGTLDLGPNSSISGRSSVPEQVIERLGHYVNPSVVRVYLTF